MQKIRPLALHTRKSLAQFHLGTLQPQQRRLQRRRIHTCVSKQDGAGNGSWLDADSSPVRTDYDAVIVLAGAAILLDFDIQTHSQQEYLGKPAGKCGMCLHQTGTWNARC